MSQENVEIVRRCIDAFNERDLDLAGQYWDAGAVQDWSRSEGVDAAIYRGLDAIRAFWGAWLDMFEFDFKVEEFIERGEYVVMPNLTRLRGRDGVEVEAQSVVVATVREGRIARWTLYNDHAEALKAVGLAEQATSENLDLVRSIYAEWARGDFGRADWAHPEIEFVRVGSFVPGRESRTGLAGMAAGFRDFLVAWQDYRAEAKEYRELDNERVLVFSRSTGRGKTSGPELGRMPGEGAVLFHIHDGKVTRLVLYGDRDRALADLGIKE